MVSMRARLEAVPAPAAAEELIGRRHSYECRASVEGSPRRDRAIVHDVSERPLATQARRATERRPVSAFGMPASAAGCLERAQSRHRHTGRRAEASSVVAEPRHGVRKAANRLSHIIIVGLGWHAFEEARL